MAGFFVLIWLPAIAIAVRVLQNTSIRRRFLIALSASAIAGAFGALALDAATEGIHAAEDIAFYAGFGAPVGIIGGACVCLLARLTLKRWLQTATGSISLFVGAILAGGLLGGFSLWLLLLMVLSRISE